MSDPSAARPVAFERTRLWERLLVGNRKKVLAGCAVAFVAVASADVLTPVQLELSFAYVSILVVVCWHGGPLQGLAWSAAAFAVELAGFAMAGAGLLDAYNRVALANRLFTFLLVVALMAAIRELYVRLERTSCGLRAMSRHLVALQEVERRRLSRELHDCAGQQLVGLGINLDIARHELPDTVPQPVRDRLAAAKASLDAVLEWMRGALEELRPTMLDSLGLAPAVQKLARDLPQLAGMTAEVRVLGERRALEHDAELAVFRIVQESLINASRHSRAATAVVTLDYRGPGFQATVEDSGRGFETSLERRATPRGFGVLIMQERATAVGARLQIDSRPGLGTRVSVLLAEPAAELGGDRTGAGLAADRSAA